MNNNKRKVFLLNFNKIKINPINNYTFSLLICD